MISAFLGIDEKFTCDDFRLSNYLQSKGLVKEDETSMTYMLQDALRRAMPNGYPKYGPGDPIPTHLLSRNEITNLKLDFSLDSNCNFKLVSIKNLNTDSYYSKDQVQQFSLKYDI